MTARSLRTGLLAAPLVVATLAGCSSDNLRPVRGTVTGADPAVLAGSAVELALESDPTVRAAGTIEPDGRFSVESVRDGKVRPGAPEGTYKARIVLADDEPAAKKKAAKAVAARYQTFEKSGLTVRVPADGDLTLSVAGR